MPYLKFVVKSEQPSLWYKWEPSKFHVKLIFSGSAADIPGLQVC